MPPKCEIAPQRVRSGPEESKPRMTAMDVGSGGAAGILALLKRAAGIEVTNSLAKAAERFLRRQVELEDASPFDAAPAAKAEHAAHMSEAQAAQRLQAEIERDMRRRRRMRLRHLGHARRAPPHERRLCLAHPCGMLCPSGRGIVEW